MNTKHRIRIALGHSPVTLPLFPLISKNIKEKRLAVGRSTQCCIEGFPRSANSYFTWYFRQSNPVVEVAHHLHVPANVLAAKKRNLPTVVLIRDPEDAVLSAAVGFSGRLSITLLLKDYLHFYRSVFPALDNCVLSDFSSSTKAPSQVIHALNKVSGKKFNTNLPDDISESDFSAHAREVEARLTGDAQNINLLTTPDKRKDELKLHYKEAVRANPLLSEAQELYKNCLAHRSMVELLT